MYGWVDEETSQKRANKEGMNGVYPVFLKTLSKRVENSKGFVLNKGIPSTRQNQGEPKGGRHD
jgi:hypothetical protein